MKEDTSASWNDEYINEYSSGDTSDLSPLGSFVAFLYLLSFYWTHQVLKNIVRATVSGVVGTWWFTPAESGSFCSIAVAGSFIRSTTYSFGIHLICHPLGVSLRSSTYFHFTGHAR